MSRGCGGAKFPRGVERCGMVGVAFFGWGRGHVVGAEDLAEMPFDVGRDGNFAPAESQPAGWVEESGGCGAIELIPMFGRETGKCGVPHVDGLVAFLDDGKKIVEGFAPRHGKRGQPRKGPDQSLSH